MVYISTLSADGEQFYYYKFSDEDEFTKTMWVYDTEEEKIISCLIDVNGDSWRSASEDEAKYIEDFMINESYEVIQEPERWGLTRHVEIPDLNAMVLEIQQMKM